MKLWGFFFIDTHVVCIILIEIKKYCELMVLLPYVISYELHATKNQSIILYSYVYFIF